MREREKEIKTEREMDGTPLFCLEGEATKSVAPLISSLVEILHFQGLALD